MTVLVRRTADLEAVRRLGVANGLEESGREDERIVAAWGAWEAGRLVGAIALERQGDLDVVNWLAVDEAHRRRGVAGRLLDELVADALRRGLPRLWATARTPAFFLAKGFAEVPPGRRRDALLAGCAACPQFGAGCRPQALSKVLGEDGGRA